MKKLIAISMALAMIMALSIPALGAASGSAASNGDSSGDIGYTGEVLLPTVDLEVYNSDLGTTDTGLVLVFNPYGVVITSGSAGSGGGAKVFASAQGAQIFASPRVIKNLSNCGVAVSVGNVKTTAKGTDVNIVSKAPTKATNTLDAFIYLEGNTTPTDAEGVPVGDYVKDNAHVVFPADTSTTTLENKFQTLFTLAAASGNVATWGQIGIGGALQNQHSAKDNGTLPAWTSSDTVSVSYRLSIAPTVVSAS